jgi:hypothetical protein
MRGGALRCDDAVVRSNTSQEISLAVNLMLVSDISHRFSTGNIKGWRVQVDPPPLALRRLEPGVAISFGDGLEGGVIVRWESCWHDWRLHQGIASPCSFDRAVGLRVVEARHRRLRKQEVSGQTSSAEPGVHGHSSFRVFIHRQVASVHQGMPILPGREIEERPGRLRILRLAAGTRLTRRRRSGQDVERLRICGELPVRSPI